MSPTNQPQWPPPAHPAPPCHSERGAAQKRLIEIVEDAVAKAQDTAIESTVREELNNFIYKDTRRRPRLLIQTTPL